MCHPIRCDNAFGKQAGLLLHCRPILIITGEVSYLGISEPYARCFLKAHVQLSKL